MDLAKLVVFFLPSTSMKLDGLIAFGHGILQTHLLSAIFYKGNNFCDLIFAFQILNPF